MNPDLGAAFQITITGMAFVFAAIIVLWVLMALIVRLTPSEEELEDELILVSPGIPSEFEQKRRAAIVAVAVALARQKDTSEPHLFPLPPTAIVSAWQAVLRTRMIIKRGLKR